MKNTLLREFEKYMEIKRNADVNADTLTPTVSLPLMCYENIEIGHNLIRKIDDEKDNSVEIINDLLEKMEVPKSNISALKFISYELISNIQDHSKFDKGYIGGSYDSKYCELAFIDNGITIPNSFENAEYSFKHDCDAILNAVNGLSTKNELGYAERGTGLNNTANITVNGGNGEILIVSRNALVNITTNTAICKELPHDTFNGTMVSVRIDTAKKIDIYNHLNKINYIF